MGPAMSFPSNPPLTSRSLETTPCYNTASSTTSPTFVLYAVIVFVVSIEAVRLYRWKRNAMSSECHARKETSGGELEKWEGNDTNWNAIDHIV